MRFKTRVDWTILIVLLLPLMTAFNYLLFLESEFWNLLFYLNILCLTVSVLGIIAATLTHFREYVVLEETSLQIKGGIVRRTYSYDTIKGVEYLNSKEVRFFRWNINTMFNVTVKCEVDGKDKGFALTLKDPDGFIAELEKRINGI
jgi:hypothetical protein